MTKSVKKYILTMLLTASLVPILALGVIFFTQSYSFQVDKDIENINYILDREKKHIEDFVNININDMSIIALSADIKSQNQDNIIGIFTRFLNARKDFYKIKYIYPNGKIIEADRENGGRVYMKSPLSVEDIFCLNNGNFAMYSGKEEEGEHIIYSYPVIIDGLPMGVVAGYMPITNINFLTVDRSNYNLGRIYIKDSRGRYVTMIKNEVNGDKNDIEVPIAGTDWRLYAKLDRVRLAVSTLRELFSNIVIFFALVIVAIIPIAIYIAEYLTKPMDELIYCTKSLTKLGGRSPAFYRINEAIELKRNFNKMIDLIDNNKSGFEEIAYIDKLTGLYNQRFIEDKLMDRIELIDNNKIYFLMLGVNILNSQEASMEQGLVDVALLEIGNLIKNNIRFMDIPIRYSQREFLIILTGIERPRALMAAEKIVSEAEGYGAEIKGREIKLKLNFGLAEYTGDMGRAIDESSQFLNSKGKINKQ